MLTVPPVLTSPLTSDLTIQNVYNYYQTFLNIPVSPISDLGPGGNSHLRGRSGIWSGLGESVWSALTFHLQRIGLQRQFNHEDWMVGLIEKKGVCSNKTVLTFKKVGRLGNQLSSYANMLVSQRLFNLNSYLPSKAVLENIQSFFENVTMPVLTEQKAGSCRVEVREADLRPVML